MTGRPAPYNSAQAFEDRVQRDARRYEANGMSHDPRAGNGAWTNATPLIATCPISLAGKLVPEPQWLAADLVPMHAVTMISGDGGVGKSILALQLATACALGRNWIRVPTLACPALVIACEDTDDELHRRQDAVLRHYGAGFEDLKHLHWSSRVGLPNELFTYRKEWGFGEPTPLLGEIREEAKAKGARLVVLDSLHDLFGGSENNRGQARQFIGALRRLALAIDGAVLLLAHPSLSGLNSGTGAAGSTAWNNAVRSRVYFRRPEGAEADGDARELKTMKANYAKAGGKIELVWQDGVFVPAASAAQARRNFVDALTLDAALLAGLRQLVLDGTRVAADPAAKTGFANIIRRLIPACEKFSFADCRAAQDRLLASGKVVKVELGPPSRRIIYLRPTDTTYPGEGSGDGA